MSENSEKVLGVKFLPIFPLPVVLLPNELLPLHIFEPRYRKMLEDIKLEKNLFGVSYFDAQETDSSKPEIGSFGCVAEVRESQTLEDGRSNIVTIGVIRYRLENYVQTDDPTRSPKFHFLRMTKKTKPSLNRWRMKFSIYLHESPTPPTK